MATQLTATQKALLDAVGAVLDDAFLNGCEYPPGTKVVPAINGYASLQSVNGVDLRPEVKSVFKAAIVGLMLGVEAIHVVGAGGEPSFASAWQNYGGAYNTAGFYKDAFSRVFLRGLVKPTGANAGGLIFQLPAGYRPSLHELHFAQGNNSSTYTPCRVDIDTDGSVSLVNPATLTDWISLDSISFRAP